jgi:hypothetical protein
MMPLLRLHHFPAVGARIIRDIRSGVTASRGGSRLARKRIDDSVVDRRGHRRWRRRPGEAVVRLLTGTFHAGSTESWFSG